MAGACRCFKCPRERRPGEDGWYVTERDGRHGLEGRMQVFVCPQDYEEFAPAERTRWVPLCDRDAPLEPSGPPPSSGLPVRTPDELAAALTRRGLTGWALLVRDVAEGRIRRVFLRQLPADSDIREALVAFLQSAGAEITLSRGARRRTGGRVL